MKQIDSRRRAWVAAGLLCSAAGSLAQQTGTRDAVFAHGEQIARQQCAACHIVAPDQQSAPILKQQIPGFKEIAQRPATSADSLRKFLSKTHWDMKSIPVRMPEPLLTDEQITAVSRYILSLRGP
jgi:mono/diheme cytochrome c family protein